MQSLNGKVAALCRFISKATDRCVHFFDALKKEKGMFVWTPECGAAFQELMEHLKSLPVLSKPVCGEDLYLYLAVSPYALSAALVREEQKAQQPVYYISKRLTGAESRYPKLEKLAYCLLIAARKLRSYFQAHPIRVLTDQQLRQVLHRPETSGRLLKWSIELSQYEITYHPRAAIKGQVLADFISEFTPPLEGGEASGIPLPKWKLYVDGASNNHDSGAGVILITPEGRKISYALSLAFKATNNEAEYEALIIGLKLAREIGINEISIHSDSQLVVNQVTGEFQAKCSRLARYLSRVKEILDDFDNHVIEHVPREENAHADFLAKLASYGEAQQMGVVLVETLSQPSIEEVSYIMEVDEKPTWMTPFKDYLLNGVLPTSRNEARKLLRKVPRFLMQGDTLYRRGFSAPLLRCVSQDEAREILENVHEGNCGDYAGGQNLARKILRYGYFWPTLNRDALNYAQRCDRCQRFAKIPRAPANEITQMVSPWPFAVWGIDLIGELPMARGGAKYVIVAVDYFTKWVEAEPMTTITSAKVVSFVIRNIIYRYGVPYKIITDNGTQFESSYF